MDRQCLAARTQHAHNMDRQCLAARTAARKAATEHTALSQRKALQAVECGERRDHGRHGDQGS